MPPKEYYKDTCSKPNNYPTEVYLNLKLIPAQVYSKEKFEGVCINTGAVKIVCSVLQA